MEFQTALLVFIVLFALAIGFFLGLFLISLDVPFLRKLFQKEEEDGSPGSAANQPAGPEISAQPVIKKPSPDSHLILQVWKEAGQPPVYESGGKYLPKEDLPQDILNIITIREDSPPKPAPTPPPAPEEVKTAPEPSPEPEDDEETEVKMLSVVDEVNDILQRKLHGSPLAGKGIHLMENHNKEIRFWVGLESYNDVSEIPDPEVQEMINAAVKEWENSRE